jgi:hypothetical protein
MRGLDHEEADTRARSIPTSRLVRRIAVPYCIGTDSGARGSMRTRPRARAAPAGSTEHTSPARAPTLLDRRSGGKIGRRFNAVPRGRRRLWVAMRSASRNPRVVPLARSAVGARIQLGVHSPPSSPSSRLDEINHDEGARRRSAPCLHERRCRMPETAGVIPYCSGFLEGNIACLVIRAGQDR